LYIDNRDYNFRPLAHFGQQEWLVSSYFAVRALSAIKRRLDHCHLGAFAL
jgi:hypothetical protein